MVRGVDSAVELRGFGRDANVGAFVMRRNQSVLSCSRHG